MQKCDATNPNEPGTIGKLSVHRWVQRQKASARSKVKGQLDCGPVKVGKWVWGVSNCRRTISDNAWAGAEMGAVAIACGSVQRAQWVFETRGGPWGLGMVKALLGTREWVWDGKLES